MTDKPFLTIREVADLLQVSNRTVYNLYITVRSGLAG